MAIKGKYWRRIEGQCTEFCAAVWSPWQCATKSASRALRCQLMPFDFKTSDTYIITRVVLRIPVQLSPHCNISCYQPTWRLVKAVRTCVITRTLFEILRSTRQVSRIRCQIDRSCWYRWSILMFDGPIGP